MLDDVQDHARRYARAYESGVLVPERHHRLVEEHAHHASAAGIPPECLWTPVEGYLTTPEEVEYARNVKRREVCGLVYVGRFDPPVEQRMASMAGLFLRNFLTCRVVSADRLVRERLDGEGEDRTPWALFLYGLSVPRGTSPGLRAQIVVPLLQERVLASLQNIIEVPSRARLEDVYGGDMIHHLESNRYALVEP